MLHYFYTNHYCRSTLLYLFVFEQIAIRTEIIDPIAKACASLRSGVCKNGILTLEAIAQCLPGGLDNYADVMVS